MSYSGKCFFTHFLKSFVSACDRYSIWESFYFTRILLRMSLLTVNLIDSVSGLSCRKHDFCHAHIDNCWCSFHRVSALLSNRSACSFLYINVIWREWISSGSLVFPLLFWIVLRYHVCLYLSTPFSVNFRILYLFFVSLLFLSFYLHYLYIYFEIFRQFRF